MIRHPLATVVRVGLLVLIVALVLLPTKPASPRVPVTGLGATRPAATTGDPVIGAAGDISCGAGSSGASCKQTATSNLLLSMNPAAVLPLGDTQYEQGAYSDFQSFYDPSWGRLRAVTHP